ncbi:MAG TPA: serine hydrolase [Acidimicrobiia bacterium]
MRRSSALAAIALAFAACGQDAAVPPSPSETTTAATSTAATTEVGPSDQPASGVQDAIDWFVALLNEGEISESRYASRFAPVFRDQVPHEGFVRVVSDLRRSGPFVLVDRGPDGAVGFAIIENETGARFRVSGALDDDGRFEGLLVQPEEFPEMANPPASVEAAFDLLDLVGVFGGMAAEITDGSCSPIASVRADEPIPLGSVFKLYVLGALALQVDAGAVSWDDELVITDEAKSIPTGVLQDRDSGSTVSVRRAAELMISISDNTAADLIARRLGRTLIEESLADLGVSDPSRNTPFLTTLEFAVLKLFVDDAARLAFIEGDVDTRREMLVRLGDVRVGQLDVGGFVDPVEPHAIEWFATPNELCSLAVALTDLSRRPGLEPIDAILGVNPGIPDDDGRWSSIWFKGGSEPGLLAVWWTVEASDGRRFVLTGSNVDPLAPISGDDAILVWSAARDVLAGG